MSAVNETETASVPDRPRNPVARPNSERGIVIKVLDLFSSVRFGIILLILLVVASMLGMLIMQQNVDGFDKYYAELTPSQKLVYGGLGFFDIYHSWYFNVLLLVLSLNIVLASIDRFPKTWTFISRKKLDASAKWMAGQESSTELSVRGTSAPDITRTIADSFRSSGLKPIVTEKGDRQYVFGESGVWNRLGAYAVHVALLLIFGGGFLTAQFGREGQMILMPGVAASTIVTTVFDTEKHAPQRSVIPLPFTVTCVDIQQKLIRQEGSIMADNTLDWLTWIKIKDETGEREALVHLNDPFDYRGFRFFQASFVPNGKARNITLRLTPESGGQPFDVAITRNGSTALPDGTRIDFKEFYSEFAVGADPNETGSAEYGNPAAELMVTTPAGEQKRAFAFGSDLPDNAPVGRPVAGYKIRLKDFEKVPMAHTLAVQRDPGKLPFYIGGTLLMATLCAVFFFSHKRVWALVEKDGSGGYRVILAGNTNRNKLGFEDKFKKLTELIRARLIEE